MKKLKHWLEKIGKHDFYGADLASQAADRLLQCEEKLEEFSQAVFAVEQEQWENRPFPPSEGSP